MGKKKWLTLGQDQWIIWEINKPWEPGDILHPELRSHLHLGPGHSATTQPCLRFSTLRAWSLSRWFSFAAIFDVGLSGRSIWGKIQQMKWPVRFPPKWPWASWRKHIKEMNLLYSKMGMRKAMALEKESLGLTPYSFMSRWIWGNYKSLGFLSWKEGERCVLPPKLVWELKEILHVSSIIPGI